jgi:hypothetical protein
VEKEIMRIEVRESSKAERIKYNITNVRAFLA